MVGEDVDVGDDEADDHHGLQGDETPQVVHLQAVSGLPQAGLTLLKVWLQPLPPLSQRSWRIMTTIMRVAFPTDRM